jgi:serine/threonine-protein kinase
MTAALSPGSIINFVRRRDYILVKPLGKGACGETVLLRDDLIDSLLVCKKYSPFAESMREELFKNFLREIKLLHHVLHQNVVRVFNYYVYPDQLMGFILMEYVEGADIEEYLRANPETINDVFTQTVEGFAYLESAQILHRDIRPRNLLVRSDGIVKIIDLGFSKRIEATADFDKSISLNWWCEPPTEFSAGTYDHSTEVYFVGKLFEKMISDLGVEQFKHGAILERMCRKNPSERIANFLEVKNDLSLKRSEDIDFEEHEQEAYRQFSSAVSYHVTKVEQGLKYVADIDRIRAQLEAIYRSCMLEDEIPDCAPLLRALLDGQWYYRKSGFQTSTLRDFVRFLRSASVEKQRIAFANLHTRLDAIQRYAVKTGFDDMDDDIPF